MWFKKINMKQKRTLILNENLFYSEGFLYVIDPNIKPEFPDFYLDMCLSNYHDGRVEQVENVDYGHFYPTIYHLKNYIK